MNDLPVFGRPLWLLLFVPTWIVLWKLHRTSYAEGTVRVRWFWLALRTALIALIFVALADLQFLSKVQQNQVLFLVDVSESVAPAQQQRAIDFINAAMDRIASPHQAGIIVYGASAEVERFPAPAQHLARFETQVEAGATDLGSAMRLADALFAGNYAKNLVILSDGLDNAGDAETALQMLRQQKVSIHAFYLPPADQAEARIEGIRLPDDVRLKQNFHIEVVASSNHDTPATVQLFRNNVLIQEGSIRLRKMQKTLIRLPQTLQQPGMYRYQVQLNPAQDFRVENNVSEGWINVQGPPKLLLLDSHPDDLQGFKELLVARGFSVDIKASQYIPLSVQEMLMYQAILLRNVPASAIHNQMPLIRQYVHDFGGGFAMLGSPKSFGPGGYHETDVEKTLPVRMDLINKKYLADVALVIVIDKSGSMSFTDRGRQKIDLADEGSARIASMLKNSDQLGVLAVDSVPKWAYNLRKLNARNDAIQAITSIRAGGGGIYVYSGLKEAYSALREVKAPVKHVILFADTADCEEKEGPGGQPALVLARHAQEQDQISTTTIGIGQSGDPDVNFLRELAVIGAGRFYFTNDMFTLPEIFTQESAIVQRFYINEEPFTPRVAQIGPLLEGIDAVPDLTGYVATTPKTTADVALISHRQDPVLASWRYGMGHSIAFTSDPVSSWSQPWKEWPELERFWGQLARYLARQSQPANFRASFQSVADGSVVTIEALNAQGELENDATFYGVVVDSAGNKHELQFSQNSPGRYQAHTPGKGNLFGKIFKLQNESVEEEAIIQFSGAKNLEGGTDRDGKARLKQLAEKLVESPQDLQFSSAQAVTVQPLGQSLLMWAAFLFMIDVAARKLQFSRLFRRKRETSQNVTMVASPIVQLKKRKKEIADSIATIATIDTPTEERTAEVPQAQQPETTRESDYLQRLKSAKRRSGS